MSFHLFLTRLLLSGFLFCSATLYDSSVTTRHGPSSYPSRPWFGICAKHVGITTDHRFPSPPVVHTGTGGIWHENAAQTYVQCRLLVPFFSYRFLHFTIAFLIGTAVNHRSNDTLSLIFSSSTKLHPCVVHFASALFQRPSLRPMLCRWAQHGGLLNGYMTGWTHGRIGRVENHLNSTGVRRYTQDCHLRRIQHREHAECRLDFALGYFICFVSVNSRPISSDPLLMRIAFVIIRFLS